VARSIPQAHPIAGTFVEVKGRAYATPKHPSAVIVVEGFSSAYLEYGLANGTPPTMKSFMERRFVGIAICSLPSTTT